MAKRTSVRWAETIVEHVAEPFGPGRENGPHLDDLRAFVDACDGLPNELPVRIDNGQLSESGRRNVTFRVVARQPLDADGGDR